MKNTGSMIIVSLIVFVLSGCHGKSKYEGLSIDELFETTERLLSEDDPWETKEALSLAKPSSREPRFDHHDTMFDEFIKIDEFAYKDHLLERLSADFCWKGWSDEAAKTACEIVDPEVRKNALSAVTESQLNKVHRLDNEADRRLMLKKAYASALMHENIPDRETAIEEVIKAEFFSLDPLDALEHIEKIETPESRLRLLHTLSRESGDYILREDNPEKGLEIQRKILEKTDGEPSNERMRIMLKTANMNIAFYLNDKNPEFHKQEALELLRAIEKDYEKIVQKKDAEISSYSDMVNPYWKLGMKEKAYEIILKSVKDYEEFPLSKYPDVIADPLTGKMFTEEEIYIFNSRKEGFIYELLQHSIDERMIRNWGELPFKREDIEKMTEANLHALEVGEKTSSFAYSYYQYIRMTRLDISDELRNHLFERADQVIEAMEGDSTEKANAFSSVATYYPDGSEEQKKRLELACEIFVRVLENSTRNSDTRSFRDGFPLTLFRLSKHEPLKNVLEKHLDTSVFSANLKDKILRSLFSFYSDKWFETLGYPIEDIEKRITRDDAREIYSRIDSPEIRFDMITSLSPGSFGGPSEERLWKDWLDAVDAIDDPSQKKSAYGRMAAKARYAKVDETTKKKIEKVSGYTLSR